MGSARAMGWLEVAVSDGMTDGDVGFPVAVQSFCIGSADVDDIEPVAVGNERISRTLGRTTK